MTDIKDNAHLIKARQDFQIKQLEFNIEAAKLRILELDDEGQKYKDNITATELELTKLRAEGTKA